MSVSPPIAGLSNMVEPWPRRVRGLVGHHVVVDSLRAQLYIPAQGLPVYYFPASDVTAGVLGPGSRAQEAGPPGPRRFWSLAVGDQVRDNAAWTLTEPGSEVPALREHIAFRWNAVDSWFEEDEEIFVHPKSPYHRIDVLRSSREVRVAVGDRVLAHSRRPCLLFETGLPTRYYLPVSDVRMDLLKASQTATQCPYKGMASYWSIETDPGVSRDIAWMYRFPIPECPKIEGLLSFFNEHCDIWLDGELRERPVTPWS